MIQTTEEWQRSVTERLDEYDKSIRDFNQRIHDIQSELTGNTVITTRIAGAMPTLNNLLEIMRACEGGFKVLGWFGKIVKWIGGVVIAGVAIVSAYHKWKG